MKSYCVIILLIIILSYFITKNEFYYTKYQLKFIHNELIDIFKKLKIVLEKHKIKYWAIGGTLLGIIRNNEMIPWDDDMDLGMLKTDFLKLKYDKHVHKDLNEIGLYVGNVRDKYRLFKIKKKNEHDDYSVNNIFIDIFCMELIDDYYVFLNEHERELWPNSKFKYNELFPLKTSYINNISIKIPNNSLEYINTHFGEDWKIPKRTHNHISIIKVRV